MPDVKTGLEQVLHTLIDLASGHRASLPHAEALRLHEEVTPGYNDKPLTDAEKASLAELQERQKREKADAAKPPAKAG